MEDSNKQFLYDVLYPTTSLELPFGRLTQVAEVSLIRSSEIPEHTQISHEITYVISGEAVITSEDHTYYLCPGMIHFIKSGFRHKLVASDEDNFRFICIGYIPNIDCEVISSYNKEVHTVDHTTVNDDGTIRKLSEMLIDEMYSGDSEQHTMLDLYLKQILISLARLIRGRSAPKRVNKASSSFTLYHTLRYIDNEYMNITDIKGIAEALSYNEYYLSHLFKEKIGMGIKEYINKKKISDACELLSNSNLTISEISEKLGFASPHAFSQAFKRRCGVSPTSYQKTHIKHKN
ncbi:MAG: helix-turn-helix domain-containing protein [Clostridia bacterium]|nr:helix-turn-helix domain-containing protein [Clostridia bacterium]